MVSEFGACCEKFKTMPGAHTWIVWRHFLNEVAPQMSGPAGNVTN
jgi:hypothetical protein